MQAKNIQLIHNLSHVVKKYVKHLYKAAFSILLYLDSRFSMLLVCKE